MTAPLSYFAVIAIWATTPLAIKLSNDSVSPLAALGLRTGIAVSIALLVVAVWRRKSFFDARYFKGYMLASISIFPNMPLVYYAAEYIPSGLISVMFGLSPFLTGVMAHFMLGEHFFSPRKCLAQIFAVLGLVMIFIDQLAVDREAALGVLLMLMSISLYSFSLVAVKRQSLKHSAPAFDQSVGAMLLAIPGIVVCWYFLDGETNIALSQTSAYSIVYLAIVGSLIGFMAFYHVLNTLSVTMVSMIPMITPVLALWLGVVVANETVTANTVAGSLLILAGLGLYEGLFKPRVLAVNH